MKREEIKNILSSWSRHITRAFQGLRIRFEYSEDRGVFLVSLYPEDVDDIDRLSAEVMLFEDRMEDEYGDNAPLFCDNEKLFTLGPDAETIVWFSEPESVICWNLQIEDVYADAFQYNLAA